MTQQLTWQKENGFFWPDVKKLMEDAINADNLDESALAELLGKVEGIKGMSYFGKENWVKEFAKEFAQAGEGLSNWKVDEVKEAGNTGKNEVVNEDGKSVGKLTYDKENDVWKDASGGTYSELQWDEANGQFKASGYTAKQQDPKGGSGGDEGDKGLTPPKTS